MDARAFLAATPFIISQIRVGMSGLVGLDIPACLAVMQAQNVDVSLAAIWLPFWERGLLAAVAKQKSKDDQ